MAERINAGAHRVLGHALPSQADHHAEVRVRIAYRVAASPAVQHVVAVITRQCVVEAAANDILDIGKLIATGADASGQTGGDA